MRFSRFIIFCLWISLFKVDACTINQTIVEMNANAITTTIQRSIAVDQERINDNLDFIYPTLGQLTYDETSLATLVNENTELVERSRRVLRHNRLGMFVSECRLLHDQAETHLIKKYALFILLDRVLKKLDRSLLYLHDQQSSCRSSEVSKDPSVLSLSSDEEEDDILCDKNISIFMDYHTLLPPLQKLSLISLNYHSFSESSFTYFEKQLATIKHSIRITSDLQRMKIGQLDILVSAIHTIDGRHSVAEIVFMNGSSRKFNRLFSAMEDIYNSHVTAEKPVTIVYSTSSESQVAYKKLYTLRGVEALPHSYLDDIIGLSSSLTAAIKSPEKKSHVIEIQETEACDVEKLNQAVQKLKSFKQPIIIKASKHLSKLRDFFEQLTVTS